MQALYQRLQSIQYLQEKVTSHRLAWVAQIGRQRQCGTQYGDVEGNDDSEHLDHGNAEDGNGDDVHGQGEDVYDDLGGHGGMLSALHASHL